MRVFVVLTWIALILGGLFSACSDNTVFGPDLSITTPQHAGTWETSWTKIVENIDPMTGALTSVDTVGVFTESLILAEDGTYGRIVRLKDGTVEYSESGTYSISESKEKITFTVKEIDKKSIYFTISVGSTYSSSFTLFETMLTLTGSEGVFVFIRR